MRYKPICPYCKEKIYIHQHKSRVIRDIPLWDYSVYIRAHYRNGFCPKCGKIVVEYLEYTKPGLRMTNRLADYIVQLGRVMSDSDIARILGITRYTVRRIHFDALKHKYNDLNYDNLRYIGIDEIAIHKGHKYATVIVDIEAGRVLSVEEDRTTESLKRFYNRLTPEQRESIVAVAMDGWKAYIKATEEMLPNAEIVTDYFHMAKRYNAEVIDKVRITTYNESEGLDKQMIKGTKFILYKNDENLDDNQRLHLEKILGTNRGLYIAYTLKEMLHSIFKTESTTEAKDRVMMFIKLSIESKIKPIKDFAGKIVKYIEFIINHAEHKISTGKNEGINNKLKNIKRRAYGFRNFQYFRLLAIDAFY